VPCTRSSQLQALCPHQQAVHCKQSRVQEAHDAPTARPHQGCQPQGTLILTHIRPKHSRLVQCKAVERQQLQGLRQNELDLQPAGGGTRAVKISATVQHRSVYGQACDACSLLNSRHGLRSAALMDHHALTELLLVAQNFRYAARIEVMRFRIVSLAAWDVLPGKEPATCTAQQIQQPQIIQQMAGIATDGSGNPHSL